MARKIGWLTFTLAGIALVAAVAFLVVRAHGPQAPAILIVSTCSESVPAIQRVGSGNVAASSRIYFDVPAENFTIHSGTPDMVIGTYHAVALRGSSTNLEIGYGALNLDRELSAAFPVFSTHREERDVRTPGGRVIGKDRWGFLKSGERWRIVRFSGGDEIGYRPVGTKEAGLFDQVVNSACVMPTTSSTK